MKSFNVYNETNKCLLKEIILIKKTLKRAIFYEKISNVYFNLIIVDNNYIHNLNKTYRKIDKETDVITFALEDSNKDEFNGIRILGDIYISIDKAKEQSISYGHSLTRELCFLSIHGFLHLLGYDHIKKDDEIKMFNRQKEILDEKKYSRR